MQKFYIKGMVCERCISIVQEQMNVLGVAVNSIELGIVTLESATRVSELLIEDALAQKGFSLLKDKKRILVQQIKDLVALVYNGAFDFPPAFRFSKYAEQQLSVSTEVISSSFSSQQQQTLEHYVIHYRLEKVKEMLVYTNHSLSHISYVLGFNSVAHLSSQFKAITGLTASHFKQLKKEKEAAKEQHT